MPASRTLYFSKTEDHDINTYSNAEALLEVLNAHGVDKIFINPGFESIIILAHSLLLVRYLEFMCGIIREGVVHSQELV